MKKKNWLLTIAFAFVALAIVSTTVLGSTYAKYVQNVSSGATTQAAGFYVGAGASSSVTVSDSLLAPGVTVTAEDVTVSYFSQVETLITASTSVISGTGVFDQTVPQNGTSNWAQLVAAYNTEYELTGSAAKTYALADLIDIKLVVGNGAANADVAAAFVDAVVAASSGNSAVTEMNAQDGANYTGYVATHVMNAMAANATTAVSVQFDVQISWKTDYVTGGTAEENQAEMDRFDTFVGNYIYKMLGATSGNGVFNATSSTESTITVSLPITATQLLRSAS